MTKNTCSVKSDKVYCVKIKKPLTRPKTLYKAKDKGQTVKKDFKQIT